MSRMDQDTADDVILDLLVEGVEPTHENLVAAVAAYPQHRDALVAFFASLGVQSALDAETTSEGCAVERFANVGVSRVLELHHRRRSATSDREPSRPAQIRLSQVLRERELNDAAVAQKAGLDVGLMMKLDLRRIRGPRPMELFRRLGEALDVPPAHVIACATGPPIPSSRGNLRKAKGPIEIGTETFDEAILASTLGDEAKAYWLDLLRNEAEPKA